MDEPRGIPFSNWDTGDASKPLPKLISYDLSLESATYGLCKRGTRDCEYLNVPSLLSLPSPSSSSTTNTERVDIGGMEARGFRRRPCLSLIGVLVDARALRRVPTALVGVGLSE